LSFPRAQLRIEGALIFRPIAHRFSSLTRHQEYDRDFFNSSPGHDD
jgi:hypothetical protein